LKIRLTPRAESQLSELPAPAARRVVRALRALEAAPHSVIAYPAHGELRDLFYKPVVVHARRWSYRITYESRGNEIWILLIHAPWYAPSLADLRSDDS
jgi:mRNA-degrading endonuclease RelE of RelBE toxin-antitoxin system